MTSLLNQRLQLLAKHSEVLGQGLRGIERETLRVMADGKLSLSAHPPALGATLTHPQITTDYAEALMEFITPAYHDASEVLSRLDTIHKVVYRELGQQMLWSQSMPCLLPAEKDIPIAWYGHSHIGMIKHVYRRGLALRYGKSMQCIAGIHYNFSLSEQLWPILQQAEGDHSAAQYYQSESYIALIRNFKRYSWLLMYLFGATPAVSACFLRDKNHDLQSLSDDTLFLPYATSLRMSDLGYQNDAQADLVPPYNTLLDYMRSLSLAVRKPYPAYQKLGTKIDGEWVQINTNVLQIENEFYATIRPKRVIRSGERPLEALCERGVQYVEVRCLDVNPYLPTGIDLTTTRFLDTFLSYCALAESPPTNHAEGEENTANFAATVKQGRLPGLQLNRQGQPLGLQQWGLELLSLMQPVAELLDQQLGGTQHIDSLAAQRAKLLDPELTPSAQVLRSLAQHRNSYLQFALELTQQHASYFRNNPPDPATLQEYQRLADLSLAEQAATEQADVGDFDSFITAYGQRTSSEVCCEKFQLPVLAASADEILSVN